MTVMKKLMATFGAVAAAVVLSAAPALAAGTGSVAPNPIPVSGGQSTANATVTWSGLANPGKTLFITQCRKDQADPTFDYAVDCSNLSEVVINASANVGGAGSKSYSIFRGENPDGDSGWGCFAGTDTAPSGVTKSTTCYIRVAEDAESNTTTDFSIPFTFSDNGGGDLPETSNVILLPVAATGVLGAAWFVQRRRRQSLAA